MRANVTLWFGVVLLSALPASAAGDKPISAEEATKKVGEKVVVQMLVRASKDRLEKHGEIYLDSETDFHDSKNLGVIITKAGAAAFAKTGVKDPAAHFKDKTIRVTGTVSVMDKKFRLVVDDPKQIEIIERKK